MQDMSYKLGAAETRLTQLEAPKENEEPRQSATDPATEPGDAIIVPAPAEPTQPAAELEPPPKKSWWRW